MFKINNIVYNENSEYKIGTVHYKKKEYKVLDLHISYNENNKTIKHFFEGVERLKYLEELQIDKEIHKKGISDYLCFENNDLEEKGMDINYKVDINLDNVEVKCRRIDENTISIEIKIAEINLLYENDIKIPLR